MDDPFLCHYILDEQGNPVPEPDHLTWAAWYEQSWPARCVNETYFRQDTPGEIRVSTVFLSTPHISLTSDEPMLYETMVFAAENILKRISEMAETDDRSIMIRFLNVLGKERWDIQKRYATKEQAKAGHANMCHFIETCLAQGLLPDGETASV